MNILSYINPVIVSVFAGLIVGAFVLLLFGKRLVAWIKQGGNSQGSAQPSVSPAPRPTMAGLSLVIATAHRSTSQFIGLIMSFASLIAIMLSVICAVAGISIISYQKFGSLLFTGIAGLATLILAAIIENISLNALKNIRLSSERITQAEQAHYRQIVKQMEEQFEEDAQIFAKIDHQKISKQEVESMKRAAGLKREARKQFEKKRHMLMRQQTRTDRHTRNTSIPFAVIGVLFSATAGGLFWHTVLASLDLWLNLTIGTMFAMAVSVTFVQSELFKRIKDEAIGEALRSGEMQGIVLRQQSEAMVLEMVVDSMSAVKQDPQTLIEMGTGIKEELKTTIRALTQQTTSRLVEDTSNQSDTAVSESVQVVPDTKQKPVARRQRKEPEWVFHPALSDVLKRYPKLNEKVASWRSAARVTISINSLIIATNHSKKIVQNRIKDGTLQVSSHNTNLVLIYSVLDWLRDMPVVKSVSTSQDEPIVEEVVVSQINPDTSADDNQMHLPQGSEWVETLSIALDALRTNPDITDEELGIRLSLTTLGIVRFWKVKAKELLTQERQSGVSNGHVDQDTLDQLEEVQL